MTDNVVFRKRYFFIKFAVSLINYIPMRQYKIKDVIFEYTSQKDKSKDTGNSHVIGFKWLYMYVKYELHAPVSVTLKFRIIKPSGAKMTSKGAPDGYIGVANTHLSKSWFTVSFGDDSYDLFNETGKWTFEILDENDELLFSKNFVLNPPPPETYTTVRNITMHPNSSEQDMIMEYSRRGRLSQPILYSTDDQNWIITADIERSDPYGRSVNVYGKLWFPDKIMVKLSAKSISAKAASGHMWGINLPAGYPTPKGEWHIALYLENPDGDDVLLKSQSIRVY